jgi:SpoIID/LytB domain protein
VRTEPTIDVGIMQGKEITFSFNTPYTANNITYNAGEYTARLEGDKIIFNNNLYDELYFTNATDHSSTFSLHGVTIGKEFHWQQQEMQTFQGALILRIIDGELHAINRIAIEDYLTSVIASEMSGTSSVELLKAHAVISRSWLLAQIEGDERVKMKDESSQEDNSQFIKWYDREAHTHFDVCADDHCQRYQGITKASSENVVEAVRTTAGEVLRYGKEICDARFSKCCGGVTEEFHTCWEDLDKPYLISKKDYLRPDEHITDVEADDCAEQDATAALPDLTDEKEATKWITSTPRTFCGTKNKRVLSQILNNYDQETTDFYRWTVEYSQERISEIINANMKAEVGGIVDLIPVKRGASGRIELLKIVGTEKTITIGKELEIRRVLSETHLFSSAFVVEKFFSPNPQTCTIENGEAEEEALIPDGFVLHGAGWGHGVGLCQIGAAVMGDRGYKYDEILLHYFSGAQLEKMY